MQELAKDHDFYHYRGGGEKSHEIEIPLLGENKIPDQNPHYHDSGNPVGKGTAKVYATDGSVDAKGQALGLVQGGGGDVEMAGVGGSQKMEKGGQGGHGLGGGSS